jgi:hypothetical protein
MSLGHGGVGGGHACCRLCAAAEADKEHMHTVNALLRSELAAALAGLDAAEYPPLKQRPDSALQDGNAPPRGSVAMRAACDSSDSSDSDAQSPRSSSGSSADGTESSCAESSPRACSGDPPKPPAREAPAARATTPHWLEAAAPDEATSQHRVLVTHGTMALLLVSMTVLQLRHERQLTSPSPLAHIAQGSTEGSSTRAKDQGQRSGNWSSA